MTPFISNVISAGGPIMLGVGLVLLKRAAFPRRLGQMPYCKACGYNLYMLNSAYYCPECGQRIKKANTVIGERQRRPGVIASVLLMALSGLLLSCFYSIPRLKQTDWYRYRPTDWVINDLELWGKRSRAWMEVSRRLKETQFNSQQKNRLCDLALAEGANPKGDAVSFGMEAFVADQFSQGRLSLTQMERFARQIYKPVIDIQPSRVYEGIPMELGFTLRPVLPNLSASWRIIAIHVDGQSHFDPFASAGSDTSSTLTSHSIVVYEAGAHIIEVTFEISLRIPRTGPDGQASVPYEVIQCTTSSISTTRFFVKER